MLVKAFCNWAEILVGKAIQSFCAEPDLRIESVLQKKPQIVFPEHCKRNVDLDIADQYVHHGSLLKIETQLPLGYLKGYRFSD